MICHYAAVPELRDGKADGQAGWPPEGCAQSQETLSACTHPRGGKEGVSMRHDTS